MVKAAIRRFDAIRTVAMARNLITKSIGLCVWWTRMLVS